MKYLHHLILFSCVLSFCTCNDFLDVTSSEKILQKDLFKESQGIRMAVNGVYKEMSSTSLYGQNLSWGFISAVGHNYEVTTSVLTTNLYYAANFAWDNSYVESITDNIWSKAYNIIANCNNIIQMVEEQDTMFFKEKALEKTLILGEMYGVRAMLHFDLFRLFAPAPITNASGLTIPYVTTYPDKRPINLSSDEVLKNIVDDMEMAKTMLAPIDTIKFRSVISSPAGRYRQSNTWRNLPEGDFFNYRGQRMNFFAATALLARIYLYMGDYDKAFENADLVYRFHKRNWFRWTSSSYQGNISNVDYIYTKRPDELLLVLSNHKNYENYDKFMLESYYGTSRFRMKKMELLFVGDLDDFRFSGWYNRYGLKRYLTWQRPAGTSYTAQNVAQNQGPLIPIIRFSEMYHILIECYIRKGNLEEAVTMLNALRLSRGAKTKITNDIEAVELMDRLVNDIIRETLTEGQTFFMYKRLNRNIFNGETDIEMKPEDWIVPIPYSETNF